MNETTKSMQNQSKIQLCQYDSPSALTVKMYYIYIHHTNFCLPQPHGGKQKTTNFILYMISKASIILYIPEIRANLKQNFWLTTVPEIISVRLDVMENM